MLLVLLLVVTLVLVMVVFLTMGRGGGGDDFAILTPAGYFLSQLPWHHLTLKVIVFK